MFHISLTAVVSDKEQHDRVYTEFGTVQDQLAGEVPSVSLTSFDMETVTGDEDELHFDEGTMFKVYDAIMTGLPMNAADARDIIDSMQNAGILFRERRSTKIEENEEKE